MPAPRSNCTRIEGRITIYNPNKAKVPWQSQSRKSKLTFIDAIISPDRVSVKMGCTSSQPTDPIIQDRSRGPRCRQPGVAKWWRSRVARKATTAF